MSAPRSWSVESSIGAVVVLGFSIGLTLIVRLRGTVMSNWNAASFFTNLTVLNGRCAVSYGWPIICVSVAAIFAWSNSGAFDFLAGSTR